MFDPLLCVVTGMERSGTTLLAQLLNAHPLVASGFECGLLLRAPADFPALNPWWDWLADPALGWALGEADRAALLSASDHATAYQVLAAAKGRNIADPRGRAIFQAAPLFVDKTPAYVRKLDVVMAHTDRPFLVTWKTPEDAWASARKRGITIPQFLGLYAKAAASVGAALQRHPDRLTVISYQSLVEDTAGVMRQVCIAIGLPEPHDLTLERYRQRFAGMIEDDDRRRAAGLFAHSGFSVEDRPYVSTDVVLETTEELMWDLWLIGVAEELDLIGQVMI